MVSRTSASFARYVRDSVVPGAVAALVLVLLIEPIGSPVAVEVVIVLVGAAAVTYVFRRHSFSFAVAIGAVALVGLVLLASALAAATRVNDGDVLLSFWLPVIAIEVLALAWQAGAIVSQAFHHHRTSPHAGWCPGWLYGLLYFVGAWQVPIGAAMLFGGPLAEAIVDSATVSQEVACWALVANVAWAFWPWVWVPVSGWVGRQRGGRSAVASRYGEAAVDVLLAGCVVALLGTAVDAARQYDSIGERIKSAVSGGLEGLLQTLVVPIAVMPLLAWSALALCLPLRDVLRAGIRRASRRLRWLGDFGKEDEDAQDDPAGAKADEDAGRVAAEEVDDTARQPEQPARDHPPEPKPQS